MEVVEVKIITLVIRLQELMVLEVVEVELLQHQVLVQMEVRAPIDQVQQELLVKDLVVALDYLHPHLVQTYLLVVVEVLAVQVQTAVQLELLVLEV